MKIVIAVSKHEVRKLRTALKEQALTIEANRLIRLREDLQNQLTYDHSTFLSDDDRKAIESQIETIQRQIYDVNSLPEEKLCDQPPTMFDWQKLAVENVQFTVYLLFKFYFHFVFLRISPFSPPPVSQITYSRPVKTALASLSTSGGQLSCMDCG